MILFLVLLSVITAPCTANARAFDHGPLDRVLSAFVDDAGNVDYAGLKADRAELDAYVDSLAAVSPDSDPDRFPTREARLAYWINAYNALVLRGVIDAYPVRSVKDIKMLSGFFNRTWFTVGGESLTLNGIEHDVIRDRFDEPRIHAAINCASVGCPVLERTAFFPETLDARLETVMRKFLNEDRNVTVDADRRTVTLSKILDWFESDFTDWYESKFNVDDAHILDYVALYREGPFDKTWKVKHHDYDWTLNDRRIARETP